MQGIRGWILITVLGLVPIAGCGSGGGDPGGPRPRAIVLVTVDGLVAEDVSAFGGPIETPNLVRLVGDGVAWGDAWTAIPQIRPGATTYLTALAPDRHGVVSDHQVPLADDIPTLTTRLREAGYTTAAFPDSSYLGYRSGLLDSFETVDVPPPSKLGSEKWLPQLIRAVDQGENVSEWIAGIPAGADYFLWVHTSRPLMAQGTLQDTAAQQSMKAFDDLLGTIIQAIEARGEWESTAFALGGTLARVTSAGNRIAGIGFSVDEAAIAVPAVIKLPTGSRSIDPVRHVWSPDLPATLAAVAGVPFDGVDGLDLREDPDEDRVQLSWATALREQAGWRRQRAARQGTVKKIEGHPTRTFRVAGPDGVSPTDGDPIDAGSEERLASALAARTLPPPVEVDLAPIAADLEALGVVPAPVDVEGRAFTDHDVRAKVADLIWKSRLNLVRNVPKRSLNQLRQVREQDAENLAGLVDLGMLLILSPAEGNRGRELLTLGATYYPTDPDALHGLVHANWEEDWKRSESILLAVLPFQPDNPDILYDLACARSLDEDITGAEEWLRKALDAGFSEWRHMQSDPDLRNLRSSGRFAELMRGYQR